MEKTGRRLGEDWEKIRHPPNPPQGGKEYAVKTMYKCSAVQQMAPCVLFAFVPPPSGGVSQ